MNNNLNYEILTRDTKGYVMQSGIQSVIEDNNLIHPEEIYINTKFTIIRFDLFTRRVVVSCQKGKRVFMALFDFNFILNNCVYTECDKDKVIEAVYLPREKECRKLTNYEYVMTIVGALLVGFTIGVILGIIL